MLNIIIKLKKICFYFNYNYNYRAQKLKNVAYVIETFENISMFYCALCCVIKLKN